MAISTPGAITLLEQSITGNYAVIAGAALIFFDHVITFGQEVQLFWGEQTSSAWLFFANRILALVYASLSVWSVMNIYTVTLYGKHRSERFSFHIHCGNLKW
ncbi:uncharacterized protein LAESUDRAFT_212465 [Laetiporus sulphureus 93-53]|uniref:DUF6533 domain-containing protein n=1 Tax=Laetiporus sulphureus 93-53 TaxID=1314785 RepID=A0A165DVP9_9APHY|nr:uncharacterized protein LAESUDRAFT_212465 [Laetiporus sulphureus 93-53]KZT05724.1 hypothetical protein LAESUDRAFT_212465 [Laetiporus sulphureus 93-53]